MSRDALIVGINYYLRLANLNSPANDAEAIAQRLSQDGDFRVRRMPDFLDPFEANASRVAHTRDLTVAQLEAALEQLFYPEGSSIPDTALFYFSGHGLRKSGRRGSEGFLATSDADPEARNWGLSLKWLRELLEESPVRQQIVWLDCCHSGELLNFSEADPGDRGEAHDRCFIAASREFEQVIGVEGEEHSALTQAILRGFDAAPLSNQWVTNETLIAFLRQELKAAPQRFICKNLGAINLVFRSSAATQPSPVSHDYFEQEVNNISHGTNKTTVSNRRRDFYTRKISRLEEDFSAVEEQLTITSGAEKVRLEATADRLLTEIEELDNRLAELDLESSRDSSNGLEKILQKINFTEAKKIASLVGDRLNRGGSVLFLLQKSKKQMGHYCVEEVINVMLAKGIIDGQGIGDYRRYSIDLGSAISQYNEVEFLIRLASCFNIQASSNSEKISQQIREKIRSSIEDGATVFLEIKRLDDLLEKPKFLEWFIQEFWKPIAEEVAIAAKRLKGKLIVALIADSQVLSNYSPAHFCDIKSFDSSKILALPLPNWTHNDIYDWLIRFRHLFPPIKGKTESEIRRIAKKIHQDSEGTPEAICIILREYLLAGNIPKKSSITSEVKESTQTQISKPSNIYRLAVDIPQSQLFVAQRSQLTITLQPATSEQGSIQIPENTAQLYCFVDVDGLHIANNSLPILFDPKTAQPLPINFEIQAQLPGDRPYTVQLFVESPDSEKVQIYETRGQIRVVPPEVLPERLPILPPLNIRVTRKPDLILYVETNLPDGDTGNHHLKYYFTSRLPTLRLQEEFVGQVVLSHSDLSRLRTLIATNLQQNTNSSPTDNREQLISLGTYLFDRLFPPETTLAFHETFWKIADYISTCLIVEDEVSRLPWELLVPYRSNEPEPLSFFCERYHLSRWVEGVGNPRYDEIPLGDLAIAQYKFFQPAQQQQMVQDEQLKGWQKMLDATAISQGLQAAVTPDNSVYAVHLLRYRSDLAREREIVPRPEVAATSMSGEPEVRQARLNLRLKRLLITLSALTQPGEDGGHWLLPERVLPFLRAGASAVIAPWWETSEKSDRLFWSHFYQLFRERLPLGEAVWQSRLAVKRAYPQTADWLAYTLFGDPYAKAYEPELSEGYAAIECLNPDEPLRLGKTYYFRASLRSRPPVWYTDRLIQPEELSQQLQALFMAPGLQASSPEPLVMQPVGHTMCQATIELTPTSAGNYPLLVQLLERDELVKTLQLNLEVGG